MLRDLWRLAVVLWISHLRPRWMVRRRLRALGIEDGYDYAADIRSLVNTGTAMLTKMRAPAPPHCTCGECEWCRLALEYNGTDARAIRMHWDAWRNRTDDHDFSHRYP